LKKRGQAAIEFLTTYGWAILVIVIVLAALVWLGIFDAATRAPDRCTFQGGIQCDSARISSNVMRLSSLVITSRLTETIYICGLRCTNNPDKSSSSTIDSCVGGTRLSPGGQVDVVDMFATTPRCYDYFAGTSASTRRYGVGDTYNGRIELYYSTEYDSDDDAARVYYGEITAKVQP